MKIKENVQVPKTIPISDLKIGTFFRFIEEITGHQYGLGLRIGYVDIDADNEDIEVYDFQDKQIKILHELQKVIPLETNKIHITIETN